MFLWVWMYYKLSIWALEMRNMSDLLDRAGIEFITNQRLNILSHLFCVFMITSTNDVLRPCDSRIFFVDSPLLSLNAFVFKCKCVGVANIVCTKCNVIRRILINCDYKVPTWRLPRTTHTKIISSYCSTHSCTIQKRKYVNSSVGLHAVDITHTHTLETKISSTAAAG